METRPEEHPFPVTHLCKPRLLLQAITSPRAEPLAGNQMFKHKSVKDILHPNHNKQICVWSQHDRIKNSLRLFTIYIRAILVCDSRFSPFPTLALSLDRCLRNGFWVQNILYYLREKDGKLVLWFSWTIKLNRRKKSEEPWWWLS